MAEEAEEVEDVGDLVMAMPRRELYAVQGFHRRVDMRVIASLAEESWFSLPDVLAEDIDAKEIRLGVVLRRGDEILLDGQGEAIFMTPVPAQATGLGQGLEALKNLARGASEQVIGAASERVLLSGYLNDDKNPDLRPYVVLVYEVYFPPATDAPAELEWIGREELASRPVDIVSLQVLDELD